jgi:CheY-like chemotaxis protein
MPGKRILIVDDEDVVGVSIAAILSLDGHCTEFVTSALEALRRYAPDKYDLIVLDNRMPEMNGVELAQRIRSQHPAQAIILLTGYPPIRQPSTVDRVMRKPFSGDDLRQAVLDLTNPP